MPDHHSENQTQRPAMSHSIRLAGPWQVLAGSETFRFKFNAPTSINELIDQIGIDPTFSESLVLKRSFNWPNLSSIRSDNQRLLLCGPGLNRNSMVLLNQLTIPVDFENQVELTPHIESTNSLEIRLTPSFEPTAQIGVFSLQVAE